MYLCLLLYFRSFAGFPVFAKIFTLQLSFAVLSALVYLIKMNMSCVSNMQRLDLYVAYHCILL